MIASAEQTNHFLLPTGSDCKRIALSPTGSRKLVIISGSNDSFCLFVWLVVSWDNIIDLVTTFPLPKKFSFDLWWLKFYCIGFELKHIGFCGFTWISFGWISRADIFWDLSQVQSREFRVVFCTYETWIWRFGDHLIFLCIISLGLQQNFQPLYQHISPKDMLVGNVAHQLLLSSWGRSFMLVFLE